MAEEREVSAASSSSLSSSVMSGSKSENVDGSGLLEEGFNGGEEQWGARSLRSCSSAVDGLPPPGNVGGQVSSSGTQTAIMAVVGVSPPANVGGNGSSSAMVTPTDGGARSLRSCSSAVDGLPPPGNVGGQVSSSGTLMRRSIGRWTPR